MKIDDILTVIAVIFIILFWVFLGYIWVEPIPDSKETKLLKKIYKEVKKKRTKQAKG